MPAQLRRRGHVAVQGIPQRQGPGEVWIRSSQEWLDHVRLSSARAPNGSSSFVSADGLIFTNHHIAQGCIHDLSTNGKDYMQEWLLRSNARRGSRSVPGMEFVVLEDITDVTAKVNAAVKPGMSTPTPARRSARKCRRSRRSARSADMRCDVVTLYSGAMYNLYKYKKYDDIRLVFAPEFDIAFFGGDPDNFEYPRYDLDISFFRAYENGKPAKTTNYLKWSKDGAQDGELVFVSGHPGRTGRLLTMDQLDFLRDYQYPMMLASYPASHRCAAEVRRAIARRMHARPRTTLFGTAELVQGGHRL